MNATITLLCSLFPSVAAMPRGPQGEVPQPARAAPRDPAPETLEEAVGWLAAESRRLVRASRRTMSSGIAAFPPQVGIGYEAFWLRDYAYMLEGCAEAFSDRELREACLLFVNALRADGSGVDCVKFDGTPIYMPGYGTMGRKPVVDGGMFTVAVAWHTHRRLADRKLLESIIERLVATMKAVPRNPRTGLVHIEPGGWERCPYGFTDTVRKEGDLLFSSLLWTQSARRLAELMRTLGRRAQEGAWSARADRVAASVRSELWDESAGLFRAATLRCAQPDVWGSAFAVHLGVAAQAQALRIARTFEAQYARIVQRGQIRHLPGGQYWEAAGPRDRYQNGGYWATPAGWFLGALELVDPELATRTLLDLVADFRQRGVNEWVLGARAVRRDYVASATLPLAGARALLAARKRRDPLYEGFQDPPARVRPFVRWWWNGNAVTAEEILRELDVLKAAGIGGVEINPIAMPPGSTDIGARHLVWLGKPWQAALKAAVAGCRERGLSADLIVGSGWPFGGRFLKPSQCTQRLVCRAIPLEGPGSFSRPLSDLLALPPARNQRSFEGAPPPRLAFLRLVPVKLARLEDCRDLSARVDRAGRVAFTVPAGRHTLYVGMLRQAFSSVVHGAPGADGPVLDHFNAGAVKTYLERMSTVLDPLFGGKMGAGLRAMFCDSIELSGANWTTDLAREFRRRRGYELDPYLPHVLLPDPPRADPSIVDLIHRARHDYSETLVELFHERFLQVFHRWCHEHGVLSRYQAYGSPWLMDMLSGYLVPDIPEGDTWLYNHSSVGQHIDEIRYAVWNKYAASGAHLSGRSEVSCEAMTNTRGVFRATLAYVTQADDITVLPGINHSVLHGFNYSPPEAAFPGWIRYGTYFSEHNPWWTYLRCWSDYNARLSWVLQRSRPVVRAAILGPSADVWSAAGLDRQPFIHTPWYLHRLWQALHASGISADFIDEAIVRRAELGAGGLVRCGPAAYELLVLADVHSLKPASASALQRLGRGGARIALVGVVPHRSPGLRDAQRNDHLVQDSMRALLAGDGRRAARVPSPREGDSLVVWAGDLLERFGIEPDVRLSSPDERLLQMHQRAGEREIFFLVNTRRERALDFEATFRTGAGTPWRWNPESGERWAMPAGRKPRTLDLHLAPLESALLVFEPRLKAPSRRCAVPDFATARTIESPWDLALTPIQGPAVQRHLAKLVDLASLAELRSFAGTVVYRTTFDAGDPSRTLLSLGRVEGVVDATLNGHHLGVRWYGRPLYDVSAALRPGRNELRIELTTTIYNYARTLADNPTARRWALAMRPKGAPSRETIGLLGPVQLLRPAPRPR